MYEHEEIDVYANSEQRSYFPLSLYGVDAARLSYSNSIAVTKRVCMLAAAEEKKK